MRYGCPLGHSINSIQLRLVKIKGECMIHTIECSFQCAFCHWNNILWHCGEEGFLNGYMYIVQIMHIGYTSCYFEAYNQSSRVVQHISKRLQDVHPLHAEEDYGRMYNYIP